jgi:hypothetical protein
MSNPENIPLETSTSEFPVVFSRTVSGPSSYTERWTNERIKQRLKIQEALDEQPNLKGKVYHGSPKPDITTRTAATRHLVGRTTPRP